MSETSSSNTSFSAVALRWLAESVGAIRLQSAEHYQGLLERMVFPRMGDVEVAAMAEDDVRGAVEALKEEGYSESTVYMIPRLVRRVLRFAAAEGLCPTPAWNIGLGTPGKEREALILSVGQMERMLASLAENPVPRHLGLYLILSAGVSPGEVVELTWADVSFPCECIRVPVSGKKVRQVSLDERQRPVAVMAVNQRLVFRTAPQVQRLPPQAAAFEQHAVSRLECRLVHLADSAPWRILRPSVQTVVAFDAIDIVVVTDSAKTGSQHATESHQFEIHVRFLFIFVSYNYEL